MHPKRRPGITPVHLRSVFLFPRSLRVSEVAVPSSPITSAKMSEKSCTIRTRKFMTNRLLFRKQFVSNINLHKVLLDALLGLWVQS